MYIICNLAISLAFGAINYAGLEDLWPVHMEVSSPFLCPSRLSSRPTAYICYLGCFQIDYIRVYQDPARINIGCDPEDFPTVCPLRYSSCCSSTSELMDSLSLPHPFRQASYIARYPEAYMNHNLTYVHAPPLHLQASIRS
jgi:hypothetical protein